jgi:hypothetical protein
MTPGKLSNISLRDFRLFLTRVGCTCVAIKGGHEKWTKDGISRPIVIQSHIDPVPEFIVKNNLRNLNLTKEDFFRIMQK